MISRLSRRRFLAGATLAPWLVRQAAAAFAAEPPKANPILDVNVHLIGAGDNRSGCRLSPAIQGVDIARPKHAKFFRRCAEKKVLVMVHTGHEHSGPVIDIELARPEKLRLALDEGCTVVACHCGSGRPTDRPDMLPGFLKMLREYEKQGNLWGDTSVLGGYKRSRDFERLLADDFAKTRLLHGSDFPFLPLPLEFAGKIGALKAAALQLDPNFIRQDFALKDALGIARPSAERAYGLVCGKRDTSARDIGYNRRFARPFSRPAPALGRAE
jgi:hypothetical protein